MEQAKNHLFSGDSVDYIPRIRVFKSKRTSSSLKGKVFELPNTIEQLKSCIEKSFCCTVSSLTTNDFAEITDIKLIRDNDIILFEEKLSEDILPCLNEWVTFNVGGKKFTTTRATIVANEPSSMLAKMLINDEGSSWNNSCDETGAFLVDRTPEYFTPILNFLRSGSLVIDRDINPAGVLEEAKFYGIQSIIKPLEEIVERESVDGYSPISRQEFSLMLMSQPLQSQLRCQGLNFSGIDLSQLDLRYINFKLSNLSNANLSGADLSFAILEKVNLSNAVLDEARMAGVKLMHANMENASLIKCDFEDTHGAIANLEGANLRYADLSGSKLSECNLLLACLRSARFKSCTLRKANLAGADLEQCDLSGCDLHEANLRGANVKNTNFESITTPLHMSQYMNTSRI